MATRNAIERLSQRIDALAYRRRGRFTLDQLTDGASVGDFKGATNGHALCG